MAMNMDVSSRKSDRWQYGLRRQFIRLKLTGTVKLVGRPSGGAGNGDARLTIACTSWSMLATPEPRDRRTDITAPLPLRPKVIVAVPRSPRARASAGYCL